MIKTLSEKSSYKQALDPERVFVISEENKKRIKELLVNLQREKLLEDEKGTTSPGQPTISQESLRCARVLEAFTNLLFEAL